MDSIHSNTSNRNGSDTKTNSIKGNCNRFGEGQVIVDNTVPACDNSEAVARLSWLHSQTKCLNSDVVKSNSEISENIIKCESNNDKNNINKCSGYRKPHKEKLLPRRISFKTTPRSSVSRKMSNYTAVRVTRSKVAELTKKFNEIDENNTSFKKSGEVKYSTSVKRKKSFVVLKRDGKILRSNTANPLDPDNNKLGTETNNGSDKNVNTTTGTNSEIENKKVIRKKSVRKNQEEELTNVKNVINIFENSGEGEKIVKLETLKPKIPEKKPNIFKSKDIVIRNGIRKIKVLSSDNIENDVCSISCSDKESKEDSNKKIQETELTQKHSDKMEKHVKDSKSHKIRVYNNIYEKIKRIPTLLTTKKTLSVYTSDKNLLGENELLKNVNEESEQNEIETKENEQLSALSNVSEKECKINNANSENSKINNFKNRDGMESKLNYTNEEKLENNCQDKKIEENIKLDANIADRNEEIHETHLNDIKVLNKNGENSGKLLELEEVVSNNDKNKIEGETVKKYDNSNTRKVESEFENNEIKQPSISEEDKQYYDVTTRMKPNNSFLYRAVSRSNLTAYETIWYEKDKSTKTSLYELNNIQDHTDSKQYVNDEINTCFEDIINKSDKLIECVKKSYLKDEQTVSNESKQSDEDEYESVKVQGGNDQVKECNEDPYSVVEENIYQCLSELNDSNSMHSYECLSNAVSYEEVNRAGFDGYEYCNSNIPEPLPPRNNEVKPISMLERTELPSYECVKPQNNVPNCETLNSTKQSVSLQDVNLDNTIKSSSTEDNKYSSNKEINYNDIQENIYDTVKNAEHSVPNSLLDYESIVETPIQPKKIIKNEKIDFNDFVYRNNSHSKSGSLLSSQQKYNSIYGAVVEPDMDAAKPLSESAGSDKSDDWIDMSDQDEDEPSILIVREKSRARRSPSWSRKVRDQWNKQSAETVFVSSASVHYLVSGTTEQRNSLNEVNVNPLYMNTPKTSATKDEHVDLTFRDVAGLATFRVIMPEDHHRECQEITFFVGDRDSENHYETLTNQAEVIYSQQEYDDYDSFDSDSDSEDSNKLQQHDSGVDMGNYKLPDPPQSGQTYALTRFATAAGKRMQKLRRNWSLTKNDISKSLSKIAKRKSTTDLKPTNHSAMKPLRPSPPIPVDTTNNQQNLKDGTNYENIPFNSSTSTDKRSSEKDIYSKSKFLNKKPEDSYQNTNFHSSKLTSNRSQQYINLEISKSQTDIKNIKDKSPNNEDSNNLSRKKYWSFKSKFKRSLSAAPGQFSTGINNGQLSPSKSTFYLANSVDVDSEYSTSDPLSSSDKPVPTSRRKSRPMSTPDESKVSNRKSTPTLRPLSPPPPPPVNIDPKKPSRSKYSNAPSTSWYAECGLFKPDHTHGKSDINRLDRERSSSTSWYTEIGLYQTSNLSTTSSSTERSTGQDSGADCDTLQSSKSDQMHIFQDEPLYQFYNQAKLESACRHLTFDSDTDTDGYEEIGSPPPKTDATPPIHRPTAMELINPHGPSRTLWCEIPEVINSAVLSTLSAHQKRLQEAKFELITSEASYLNSLDLLHRHFESHPQFDDPSVLNISEKSQLFSNIKSVQKCSMNFLADMEHCWQDNILLTGICDIVCDHAEKNFQVYITYCERQFYMDKTLKKLKENRGPFVEILKQLESNSTCQGLSLHSFLMLPMQRITRLPLLIDAVLKRLNQGDDEYKICQIALATLTQIVSKCNDAARITEQMEELSVIARQIEFPNTITPVSILPAGQFAPARYLVKSGTLTQIIWREDAKLTFGKKFVKLPLYFFLFTDLMVITKKKSEDAYVVVDYCSRSLIQVSPGSADGSPLNIKDSPGKPLLLVTLIENHDGKTIEMMMSCSSETDQQRWLQACSPPSSENPEETLYEEWDCPQVTAIHSYVPRQADELALQAGDIVNVNRKMADGWYHGERIRDSAQGWFPGNYTLEVASAHVRARNLKQRYRLLALSGSYLESQKRK